MQADLVMMEKIMNDQYIRENEWWHSVYNCAPEVRAQMNLPAKVEIHDATLRDGEQTPGIVFDIADKIAIAEKLDEVGVERIEAGMPAVSEMDFEAIKQISKLGLKSRIYTFARAMNADIDKAVECGAPRCEASTNYMGVAGWFTLQVQYFDQNNGSARYRVRINDQIVEEWQATFIVPTARIDSSSSTRRTISRIVLRPGDAIRIEGIPEGGEFAGLDYIEILPAN